MSEHEGMSRREALTWLSRATIVGACMHACDAMAEEPGGKPPGKNAKPGAGGKAAPPPVDINTKLADVQSMKNNWAVKVAQPSVLLVRTDKGLAAYSRTCTHKDNDLLVESDGSIFCPVHDSQFELDGRVKRGPAKGPLKWLKLTVDAKGGVFVDPGSPIAAGTWVPVPANLPPLPPPVPEKKKK